MVETAVSYTHLIMTRWASDDLAGRALEHFKESGAKLRHISMKALLDPEMHEMLCPEVLSYKSYQAKIKAMGADIASAKDVYKRQRYTKAAYGSGMKYILERCPFDENHSGKDACIFKMANGAIG